MEEESINISELLDAIKRRWSIIAITTAVFVVIAIILSFFIITPKYETNVKLFIGKSSSKHASANAYNSNEVMMYQKLISTYADVIKTKDLVGQALNNANVDLKPKTVLNSLTVTPVADTQILEISYKDTNKYRAVAVINSITKEFIHKSQELISNSNVQVLENPILPEKPVSPHKKLNILVAFILGIVVGTGIVFVLEFMDNTFSTKEELEKSLGIPVLGAITEFSSEAGIEQPDSKERKKRNRRKR